MMIVRFGMCMLLQLLWKQVKTQEAFDSLKVQLDFEDNNQLLCSLIWEQNNDVSRENVDQILFTLYLEIRKLGVFNRKEEEIRIPRDEVHMTTAEDKAIFNVTEKPFKTVTIIPGGVYFATAKITTDTGLESEEKTSNKVFTAPLPPKSVIAINEESKIKLYCENADPSVAEELLVKVTREVGEAPGVYHFDNITLPENFFINQTFNNIHPISVYTISYEQQSAFSTDTIFVARKQEKVLRAINVATNAGENGVLTITLNATVKRKAERLNHTIIYVDSYLLGQPTIRQDFHQHFIPADHFNRRKDSKERNHYRLKDYDLLEAANGLKHQVFVTFFSQSGNSSDFYESMLEFPPAPLPSVRDTYTYPNVGFRHAPDSHMFYTEVLLVVADAISAKVDRYSLKRNSNYEYVILSKNYTTNQLLRIQTVAGDYLSESTLLGYNTEKVSMTTPQLMYIPINHILQVSVEYQTDNFGFARVQLINLNANERTSRRIGKRRVAMISISGIKRIEVIGLIEVQVHTFHGLLVSRSKEATITIPPAPPGGIEVREQTHSVTIKWTEPLSLYDGFVVNCVTSDKCGTNIEKVLDADTLQFTSTDDLPSGYRIVFTVHTVYNDSLGMLQSPEVNAVAFMDTENLKTMAADYIRVSNTSQIQQTNFIVSLEAHHKEKANFSKVELKIRQITQSDSNGEFVLATEYQKSDFTSSRLNKMVTLDIGHPVKDHPVPGATYKIIASVVGFPNKSMPSRHVYVSVPPHPPLALKLKSALADPQLAFQWQISDVSIQDKLFLRVCSPTTYECVREVQLDAVEKSYTIKQRLPAETFDVYLIAQSSGVNSSASNVLSIAVGNTCPYPTKLEGKIIDETGKEKNNFFKSGTVYFLKCNNGYRLSSSKSDRGQLLCKMGNWSYTDVDCVEQAEFLSTSLWILFGVICLLLVAAILYFKRILGKGQHGANRIQPKIHSQKTLQQQT